MRFLVMQSWKPVVGLKPSYYVYFQYNFPAETFKEMHARMEAVARSPAASLFTAYSWKGEAHDAKEIVLMIENWSKVLLFRSSCPLKLVLLKTYVVRSDSSKMSTTACRIVQKECFFGESDTSETLKVKSLHDLAVSQAKENCCILGQCDNTFWLLAGENLNYSSV
ncbi:hypothetical protein H5410_047821 [Solanum commersonii]|uniref:Uncharacterized protein n=1 Tax=Solanum commersonii TaxID=4109 RepID=A0A9J5XGA5_SOLCO|nr:hypothetical protein H5410_047821 [Solanum commersonii]